MNSSPHPDDDQAVNDEEFPPFVEPVRLSFDRRSGVGSASVEDSAHEHRQGSQSQKQNHVVFSRSPILERLGPWRLVREIGHGGMGIVYEAVHEATNERAALKFLLSALGMEQQRLDRFRQEARIIERLSHPNIVQLRSVELIDGHHFLVMQLIVGIGLDRIVGSISTHNSSTIATTSVSGSQSASNPQSRMQSQATENPQNTVNQQATWLDEKLFAPDSNRFRYIATLVQQAAQALSYAHAQRVVHRDIKPSNLLVDNHDVLWITDFGLAQIEGENGLTATGDLLGTLRYMSPEQAMASRVPVDHHTDVYSLGVTMYELLCGKPAFDAVNKKELLRQVLFDDPTSLSSNDETIPVALQIICEKAMQKDARHRYSTAGEMADDLFRYLSDSPIRARRPQAWELGIRWCKRNTALAASITLLTMLLIVITVGRFIYNEMSERHERTLNLLERTEAAERESSAFANLRSVARYRQTGLAGLSDHMNLLELNTATLGDEARNELRNEWLSCMARADWRFTKTIQCSAPGAAVSHSGDLVAEITDASSPAGSQRIRIRSLSGNGTAITSEPVGIDVKGISFSASDRYLVLTDYLEHWQILRCDDGSQVFDLPQAARGCDVNDRTDRVAFWHYSSAITISALKKEDAAKMPIFDAPSSPELVRFSPDGTRLAVLGILASPRLTIIDGHDGHVLHDQSAGRALTFAWSPDGKLLAVPVQTDRITIFEAGTPRVVSVLAGRDGIIASIVWHPSGNYLITSAWSGELLLRHVFTGRILVRSHERLDVASFSTDGQQIGWQRDLNSIRPAAWSPGCAIDLPWDSRKNSEIPSGISVHPGGRIAAICSLRTCQLFDLATSLFLHRFSMEGILAVEFTPSGNELVILSRTGIGSIKIQEERRDKASETDVADLLTLGPLRTISASAVLSGVISSDAQTAVVRTVEAPDQLTVLKLSDGSVLSRGGESLSGMDVSRAGKYMVRRGWRDPRLEFCDVEKGNRIALLDVGEGSIPSASIDSRFFVTSSLQHLQFWDPETWTALDKLQLDAPVVGSSPAFHPSESLLAVRLLPSRLGFVDVTNLRVVARVDELQELSAHAAAFSPDGEFFIELSGSPAGARVWHVGTMRRTLAKHGLDWSHPDSATPDSEESKHKKAGESLILPATPYIVSINVSAKPERLPTAGINEARSLYQANPDSARTQNMLAWRLLVAPQEFRSDVEALELARRSNITNPNSAAYRNTLGLACFRNQLFNEAEALLRQNLNTSSPEDLTLDLIILSMIARHQNQPSTSESFRIWAEQNFAASPPATDEALADTQILFAEDRDTARNSPQSPK